MAKKHHRPPISGPELDDQQAEHDVWAEKHHDKIVNSMIAGIEKFTKKRIRERKEAEMAKHKKKQKKRT